MIPKYIKHKILEKNISLNEFGMNDLIWEKENAKNLFLSLAIRCRCYSAATPPIYAQAHSTVFTCKTVL